MSSIRISQLNDFEPIKSEDFIALVDSSSLTTYRSDVSSLNTWFSESGSVLSSSFASRSLTSTSSSWSSASISSISSSFLVYPNTSTSSFSITASHAITSHTASYAMSSSNANTSSFSNNGLSASYAKSSSNADTASYFDFSLPSTTPPFASSSLSSSWASQSLSSSYSTFAETASYFNSTIQLANFMTSSPELSMTTASYISWSHDLGVVPKIAEVWCVCKTAEFGWLTGDEFRWEAAQEDNVHYYRSLFFKNTSSFQIYRTGGSSPSSIVIPNRTTGNPINLTFANWRFKFYYSLYN